MSSPGMDLANFEIQFNASQHSNSSAGSCLDESAMEAMEKISRPQSTDNATRSGISKLNAWLEKRDKTVDFQTVTATDFNNILRQFYAEVRHRDQKNGKRLTPSSLTGLRAAIHRFITAAPYSRPFNIVKDKEFTSANNMFQARCRLYYKEGNAKPKHKAVIEEQDMVKLNEYFNSWKSNPRVLFEKVWFLLCFNFGRRGREGWAQMKKNDYIVKMDSENQEYVTRRNTESTKNVQGGHKQSQQDYTDARMYGDTVEIFKFYLLKLNPDNDRLFQAPKKHVTSDEICWYRNEAIGKNTLSRLMQDVSKKAKLSQTYTNHCVRATTVTTLFHAGLSSQEIMAVTKHRNSASLGHYISETSQDQKKKCSSVLSAAMTPKPLKPCTVSTCDDGNFNVDVNLPETNDTMNAGDITDAELMTIPVPEVNVTQDVAYSTVIGLNNSKAPDIFENNTFNNCVFNIKL